MGVFKADYARSGRSACKDCKEKIDNGSLRLAVMVQSRQFDGKVPKWFHYECFWKKQKVLKTFEIQGFEGLRWEDQTKIKDSMKDADKKAAAEAAEAGGADGASETFNVALAKSCKSVCHGCSSKIQKNEVRISKKDTTSRKAQWYGAQDNWHHSECFFDSLEELGFDTDKGLHSISGFTELSEEDQKQLTDTFKDVTDRGKKRQADSDKGTQKRKKRKLSENPEDKAMREQAQLMWQTRDALEKDVTVATMKSILEENDQCIPAGSILDTLTDCMLFGALQKCPECSEGKLKLGIYGYNCSGNLSEWTKCLYRTQQPHRQALVIDESDQTADILKNYKYVPRVRYFQQRDGKRKFRNAAASTSHDATDSRPPPLEGMRFVMIGQFKKAKSELARQISGLGGTIATRIDDTVAAIITTEEEVKKKKFKPICDARAAGVHVIDEGFLDDVQKGGATLMIAQHSLADWGSDPVTRMDNAAKEKPKLSKKFRRFDNKYLSKDEGITKMTAKGGAIIDPDSGISESANVLKHKGALLNVVLGQVDIVTDRNAYYKLQALEAEDKTQWWVYRSWGRVGTKVGSKTVKECKKLKDAVRTFEDVYFDKTGNHWRDRDSFVKLPNKFYPLDIEYAEEDEIKRLSADQSKSSLPKSVQDLVCTIFDIEKMKNLMTEFEIDLKKMPLGKLSKKQLKSAYTVLTQLQKLVDENGSQTKFLDASNQFYTLIPHDFGMRRPDMLDSAEKIKRKTEMVDSLLEIEVAYSLLKGAEVGEDPVDGHYNKLQCDIEPLDPDSETYQTLLEYVENTHGYSHSSYKLEVEEIFCVAREGEGGRFEPFKDRPNRKLLWHGSRITNFAGILAQGLKIAPPEAPCTGYMFGKGVYFADMVSKSANYCHVKRDNPTGLLLLCEVFLGDMYELTNSKYISELPDGKNSCKGCGMTVPDPSQTCETADGVQIPCGKGIKATDIPYSSLNYNEYIVYDVDQINIKYLLKTKFNYH